MSLKAIKEIYGHLPDTLFSRTINDMQHIVHNQHNTPTMAEHALRYLLSLEALALGV